MTIKNRTTKEKTPNSRTRPQLKHVYLDIIGFLEGFFDLFDGSDIKIIKQNFPEFFHGITSQIENKAQEANISAPGEYNAIQQESFNLGLDLAKKHSIPIDSSKYKKLAKNALDLFNALE